MNNIYPFIYCLKAYFLIVSSKYIYFKFKIVVVSAIKIIDKKKTVTTTLDSATR